MRWIAPRRDWLDPLKAIQEQVLAMEAGITARRKMVEATGHDIGEVDRKTAVDAARDAGHAACLRCRRLACFAIGARPRAVHDTG